MRVLRSLKRDRRNQPSQANGSGTFSPSMLGERREADAWSPPPLPDLPQFRDPSGDPSGDAPPLPPLPPLPRETKSSKKPQRQQTKAEAPKPEPSRAEPRQAGWPRGEAPKIEPRPVEARSQERGKLEVPADPPGPYDLPQLEGDEPPVYEERPRQQPTAATVGALLAQTRAGFGQDIEEVSSALRIRPVFLRAIEESRYQDLPGLTYGVGFVRSYAHYLGLDVNDCVERFKDEAAGINRAPNLNFPTPVPEAKVPTGAIILVSLLLAGLAYLVWTYVSRDRGLEETGGVSTAAVAPSTSSESEASSGSATAATAEPAGVEAAAAGEDGGADSATGPNGEDRASDTATTAAGTALAGAAATDGLPGGAGESAAAQQSTASGGPVAISNDAAAGTGGSAAGAGGTVLFTEAASATQGSDPAVAATGAAYSGARVVLRATQDSWVQVRNAGNTSIFTRVLRAGDTYDVPDESGLTLLTGNAGGLVITVDGQEVPSLGRSGQVRRNVSLNPDSLKAN